MQKEYKEAMQRISLSESEREKILAHVKSEYEKSAPQAPVRRYRSYRKPAIAAAVAAVCVGAGLAALLFSRNAGKPESSPEEPDIFYADAGDESEWELLDSVSDIAKKTDCSTYTLKKASGKYEVKKVEVARGKKRVRITYRDKKEDDKILFEYAEEENALELRDQFDGQKKLETDKVGKLKITMYGENDCEAMVWERDGCTFALTMSRPRSCKEALQIAFGSQEKPKEERQQEAQEPDTAIQGIKPSVEEKVPSAAFGWTGDEEATPAEERDSLLGLFFEEYGFKVLLDSPASEVTYKWIGDCESFSFYYDADPLWEDCLLVGYAASGELPYDLTRDFHGVTTDLLPDGTFVKIYENEGKAKMFTFRKEGISVAFLARGDYGELSEEFLSGIFSLVNVTVQERDGVGEPMEEGIVTPPPLGE